MTTNLCALLNVRFAKGDAPGHPFRGNQWTGSASQVAALEREVMLESIGPTLYHVTSADNVAGIKAKGIKAKISETGVGIRGAYVTATPKTLVEGGQGDQYFGSDTRIVHVDAAKLRGLRMDPEYYSGVTAGAKTRDEAKAALREHVDEWGLHLYAPKSIPADAVKRVTSYSSWTGKADLAGLLCKAHVDEAAHAAATTPITPGQPSKAQLKAGNYAKGHTRIAGLDISIENPEGSVRHRSTLAAHYGYIRRTEGADGDQLDVFVKPGTPSNYEGPVFVIDQHIDGKFDEHKVMLGWAVEADARRAYLASYQPGWKGLHAITKMTIAEFKDWMKVHACKCCQPTGLLKAAPTPPSKKYVLEHEAALTARLVVFFDLWAGKVAAMIAANEKVDLGLLLKARSTDSLVKSIMKRLAADGFLLGFADLLMPDLVAAAEAGGVSGLAMINMLEDKRMTEVVPELAVEFSRARAGELIGMQYDDEKERFVQSKNSKMRIEEATREGVRRAVEKSLNEGLGVAEVKKTLVNDYAFSKTRAATIARTELANAHIQGSLEAWRRSGVVTGKRWILADTHPDDDECDEAVSEDVVPLDGVFEATGEAGPPAHPNCLCALQPVVSKS